MSDDDAARLLEKRLDERLIDDTAELLLVLLRWLEFEARK